MPALSIHAADVNNVNGGEIRRVSCMIYVPVQTSEGESRSMRACSGAYLHALMSAASRLRTIASQTCSSSSGIVIAFVPDHSKG